jgi:hypothetical protein
MGILRFLGHFDHRLTSHSFSSSREMDTLCVPGVGRRTGNPNSDSHR